MPASTEALVSAALPVGLLVAAGALLRVYAVRVETDLLGDSAETDLIGDADDEGAETP